MKTIVIHPPIGKDTPLGDAITAYLSRFEEVAILMLPAEHGGATDDDNVLEDVIRHCAQRVVLICHEGHDTASYARMGNMVANGQFFEDKLEANVVYCTLYKDGYDQWQVIAIEPEFLSWYVEVSNA